MVAALCVEATVGSSRFKEIDAIYNKVKNGKVTSITLDEIKNDVDSDDREDYLE